MKFKQFLGNLNEGAVAKEIRARLKDKLKLGTKDVSIKTNPGGMSISVSIKVKSIEALAVKTRIEQYAKRSENFEMDTAAGEILQGGNTLVFVEIDDKLKDSINAKLRKELSKNIKEFEENSKVKLFGSFTLTLNDGTLYLSVRGKNKLQEVQDVKFLGTAMIALIRQVQDDKLFLKIK